MNPLVEARLEKVKRMSRGARRVCFWLMGLVLLVTAVILLASLGTLRCNVNGLQQPCPELSSEAVTIILIAFIGSGALVLTGLYRLARLFQNYARGEIFTRASVREIRLLGYVAVGYALLQFVLFVAWLALSAGGADTWPAGVRADLPIGPVVVASFILLFSWVMDVGAELREENELTV